MSVKYGRAFLNARFIQIQPLSSNYVEADLIIYQIPGSGIRESVSTFSSHRYESSPTGFGIIRRHVFIGSSIRKKGNIQYVVTVDS
jgi:hypothetical protein